MTERYTIYTHGSENDSYLMSCKNGDSTFDFSQSVDNLEEFFSSSDVDDILMAADKVKDTVNGVRIYVVRDHLEQHDYFPGEEFKPSGSGYNIGRDLPE